MSSALLGAQYAPWKSALCVPSGTFFQALPPAGSVFREVLRGSTSPPTTHSNVGRIVVGQGQPPASCIWTRRACVRVAANVRKDTYEYVVITPYTLSDTTEYFVSYDVLLRTCVPAPSCGGSRPISWPSGVFCARPLLFHGPVRLLNLDSIASATSP